MGKYIAGALFCLSAAVLNAAWCLSESICSRSRQQCVQPFLPALGLVFLLNGFALLIQAQKDEANESIS